MPATLAGVLAAALVLQGAAPLKKSDLIRLLSTTALAPAEIADLVQRRCVSFTPSSRDKADLRALGADTALMRRLDDCARRIAPLRASALLGQAVVPVGGSALFTVEVRRGAAAAAGIRVVLRGSGRLSGGPDAESSTDARGRAVFVIDAGSAAGTYRLTVVDLEGVPLDGAATLELTVRPALLEPAPGRTGFVAGMGQRGRVGTRLPLPLVFEARDTANQPVVGRRVTLIGVNATVHEAAAVTDSTGRVRAFITLGERAGHAHVDAALEGIERQAVLVALPGPPATIVWRCGTADVTTPLAFALAAEYELTVNVQDAQGNALPVTELRVSSDDERVVRVVPAIGMTNRVTVRADHAGTTNMVAQAAGLRVSVRAAVGPAGTALTACRRSVPGG